MDVSTHFVFEHKIFNVEGSYFSAEANDSAPYFSIPLGDSTAHLDFAAIREEFAIDESSPDGKLLETVQGALKYVRVIRANDSIPNELIDGSASWTVEERHGLIARGRLTLQLIAWATGRVASGRNITEILAEMENPAVKQKVRESLQKLSRQLGIETDGITEVERRIDVLVNELSYIEALRERLAAIHQIEGLSKQAASKCSERISVQDSVERVATLLSYAFTKLNSEFELLDKLNQNIVDILSDPDDTIAVVREVRDEIHCSLRTWDDLLSSWLENGRSKDEEVLSSLLQDLHRFLAKNYPIVHTW